MENKNRRDFLKTVGYSTASLMYLSSFKELYAKMYKVDRTFKVPSWWAPHEVKGAEAAFDQYFTPSTDVKVQYDTSIAGSDYFAKLQTNLISDEPYDVMTFNADNMAPYVRKKIAMPLNDFIEKDGYDMNQFVSGTTDQWTYDGKIYGLTNDLGSFHCYFNFELFEKAGIDPPKSTEDWTWDNLVEWGKAMTIRKGGEIEQYGFVSGLDWCPELWPNLNGAKIFDTYLSKSKLDDPKVIEAFKFYQDLIYKHKISPKPGGKMGVNKLFASGRAAIMLQGTWQVGYLRSIKDDVKFQWDVGVPPNNGGKYYIPKFTSGMSIPTVARNPEISWEIVKFYASKVFAEKCMFVVLSGLPTRKDSLASAPFDQWPLNPPARLTSQFYGKLIDQGLSRQHIGFDLGSKIKASLKKIELIFSNEKQPKEYLPLLTKEINKSLKRAKWNS